MNINACVSTVVVPAHMVSFRRLRGTQYAMISHFHFHPPHFVGKTLDRHCADFDTPLE